MFLVFELFCLITRVLLSSLRALRSAQRFFQIQPFSAYERLK